MSDKEKTDNIIPVSKSVIEKTLIEQNINPVILLKGDKKIQLGPGILVERIGRGGMAAVYKFKHLTLETYYAVKIALPEQVISGLSTVRLPKGAFSRLTFCF
jgi:hypothetical protein